MITTHKGKRAIGQVIVHPATGADVVVIVVFCAGTDASALQSQHFQWQLPNWSKSRCSYELCQMA